MDKPGTPFEGSLEMDAFACLNCERVFGVGGKCECRARTQAGELNDPRQALATWVVRDVIGQRTGEWWFRVLVGVVPNAPYPPVRLVANLNPEAPSDSRFLAQERDIEDSSYETRQVLAVLGRNHARVIALGDPSIALRARNRSEEHTSELQSLTNLVCR